MRILKVLTLLVFLLCINVFSPCYTKNGFLSRIKDRFTKFEKKMKNKENKKKLLMSASILGLALLTNLIAGFAYYNYRKNRTNQAPEFPQEESRRRAKETKEIIDEINIRSEKQMAKNFRMGNEIIPRLKEVMTSIENEGKKKNLDLTQDDIADMSYFIFKNLFHLSETWKKNPTLIPID
ncbi:early transcribed membrane protein [Plasmodium reichenowi]|uniref:Early transcribed membrane protein n=1 Tax=Plasmodium reichenowi TaxID=5854 RepID=A0A060RXU1_PLARE|nr:early transcribed membrane protein [Plasmodium reichenowi]KYN98659.1 early transcribed membrane protein [Plasmodium reichenowi]CDO64421.1 early transcribed membrane protein [Plasmodium reichenowi]SOV79088.1 early transcribed membrane protein [Plasmodium reichenowi]